MPRRGPAGRKALIETDLGLVEEARVTAEEALSYSRTSIRLYTILIEAVLGRLELMLGNFGLAAESLRELPQRLAAGEMNDPTLTIWPDTIETLVALGELERARNYLERFAGSAERLGSPLARAGALRCRGLLSAAEGRPEEAFDAFERSLADAERFPLERARTLLGLGTVRRQNQQKKAAREALEQALALFDTLGARLWAEKARAELKRIAAARPPPRRSPRPSAASPSLPPWVVPTRRSLPSSTWGSAPSRPTSPTSTASSTSAAPGSRRASRPLRAPRPMPGERLPKPRVSRVSGPRP